MFNVVDVDLATFTSDSEAYQPSITLRSIVLQNPFPYYVVHSPDLDNEGVTLLCLNPILILVFYPYWIHVQIEVWVVRSGFLIL